MYESSGVVSTRLAAVLLCSGIPATMMKIGVGGGGRRRTTSDSWLTLFRGPQNPRFRSFSLLGFCSCICVPAVERAPFLLFSFRWFGVSRGVISGLLEVGSAWAKGLKIGGLLDTRCLYNESLLRK